MLAHTTAQFHVPAVPAALLRPPVRRPEQVADHTSFFPAGSEIYAQGERATSLYQIEFGAVRVYRLLADGRRQISAFHLAGETFGFDADGRHHFFAEAITGASIRIVSVTHGADLSRELFSLALRSLTRAQEHLLVLGRQNAVERVAAFLLDISERAGHTDRIDLPMSRTDIGDYLGLTIETVSRAFSKLREKGVIRLSGVRCVEIVKRAALNRMNE